VALLIQQGVKILRFFKFKNFLELITLFLIKNNFLKILNNVKEGSISSHHPSTVCLFRARGQKREFLSETIFHFINQ
jgi:hypothetical protein